jgi:SAM-dependent methyltransferase
MKTNDQIRTEVRNHYSAIARGETRTGCCAPAAPLGYSNDQLQAPGNLGLGCGNPQAIAALRPGEVVIDLGSGGGFDCFLAARAVGPAGRVIGVDGSADMIALARENATKHAATNVEFRLGEIEHLPVADATADVVISNCVVNLAPDKRAVYRDALRVLKPGGRLAISDVVAIRELPEAVRDDMAARCGCVAGAAQLDELTALLRDLGFSDVAVELEPQSREIIASWGGGFEDLVASARITARKPGGACCAPGCCP